MRQPFFAQCYIAGPPALILGIASILMRAHQTWIILGGFAIAVLSIIWYLRIEMIWLRTQVRKSHFAALRSELGTWLFASVINSFASLLILGV